jgi:thioredoxin-dependent peroxiredoxin
MRPFVTAVILLLALASTTSAEDEKALPGGPAPEIAPTPTSSSVEESAEVADIGPGDHAPDFAVESSLGAVVKTTDLKGCVSILLFAPDVAQFGAFAAENDSLTALGIRQYGVCPSSKRALMATAQRLKIAFPVLGDPNGELCRSFGMYDPDNQAIQPGLILTDEKGVVRLVFQGPPLHPEEVLLLVRNAIRGTLPS